MDITNFPYNYYRNDDHFINNFEYLLDLLLHRREEEVEAALRECTCHNLCDCTFNCDCGLSYLYNPDCPFVKMKKYLRQWDDVSEFIKSRMREIIRDIYPRFPQDNNNDYYNLCNTYQTDVQKEFPILRNYIKFREICERKYWQMTIRIVNKLKVPMAKYSLENNLSWDNYLNKMHISQCSYSRISNGKGKAYYDSNGFLIPKPEPKPEPPVYSYPRYPTNSYYS